MEKKKVYAESPTQATDVLSRRASNLMSQLLAMVVRDAQQQVNGFLQHQAPLASGGVFTYRIPEAKGGKRGWPPLPVATRIGLIQPLAAELRRIGYSVVGFSPDVLVFTWQIVLLPPRPPTNGKGPNNNDLLAHLHSPPSQLSKSRGAHKKLSIW